MIISNRGYGIGTKSAALVAAICAFTVVHAPQSLHAPLTAIMVLSASTSVFLMFFASEATDSEINRVPAVPSEEAATVSTAVCADIANVDVANGPEEIHGRGHSKTRQSEQDDAHEDLSAIEIFSTVLSSSFNRALYPKLGDPCVPTKTKAGYLYWSVPPHTTQVEWECEHEWLQRKTMLDGAVYILNNLHTTNYEVILKANDEIVIRQSRGHTSGAEIVDWTNWSSELVGAGKSEQIN
jgi:hypothetical protein